MCACTTEDSVYDSNIDFDCDPSYNPDTAADSNWKTKPLDHSNNITPEQYTSNSSISKYESNKNTLERTYVYHNMQQRLSTSQNVEDNGLKLTHNPYNSLNTFTHNNPRAAVAYDWKKEHMNHSINITTVPQTINSIVVPKCEITSQDADDSGQTKIPCNTLSINSLPQTHNICDKRDINKRIAYKRTYKERGYMCSVCHKKFKTDLLLTNHYMSLHRKNPFDSEQYPKYF